MATAFLPKSPFKVHLKLNSETLRRWRDRPKQILRMHSRMWENKLTCRRIFLRRWSWCWGRSWRARCSRWCGRTPFDRSLKDQEPHNDTLPRNELPKLFFVDFPYKALTSMFYPTDGSAGIFHPTTLCRDRESNSHQFSCTSSRDLHSERFTDWATAATASCLNLA